MNTLYATILIAPLASMLVACGGGTAARDSAANEAGAEKAHAAYVEAINLNDRARFDTTVTDDIVLLPPNSAALVGKAAVSAFVKDYFKAYQTAWVKTSVEFVVRDDLAYERYTYKSVDTPRPGGPAAGSPVVTDTGNGINIYRRGADGQWHVARDAWATDKAPAAH